MCCCNHSAEFQSCVAENAELIAFQFVVENPEWQVVGQSPTEVVLQAPAQATLLGDATRELVLTENGVSLTVLDQFAQPFHFDGMPTRLLFQATEPTPAGLRAALQQVMHLNYALEFAAQSAMERDTNAQQVLETALAQFDNWTVEVKPGQFGTLLDAGCVLGENTLRIQIEDNKLFIAVTDAEGKVLRTVEGEVATRLFETSAEVPLAVCLETAFKKAAGLVG